MSRQLVIVVIGLLVLSMAFPAAAEEESRDDSSGQAEIERAEPRQPSVSLAPGAAGSSPHNRFSARVGGFAVRFKTRARVDSETLGTGTDLDLEDDTTLDRSTTEARLDGHVRFGKRHRLDYGYVGFRRTGDRILDQQIQFGDEVFDINAQLTTEFKNDLYKLAYRYDVLRKPTWDLGLSFGFSAFAMDLGLQAIPAGGGTIVAESEDFIAPIPMLGVHTDVKLADEWYLRAGGEFFDVGVDDYEGKLTDTRIAVDWYPFRNVGFGIGFNRMRMTFEDTGLPSLDFTYIYSGTMVYVSFVR